MLTSQDKENYFQKIKKNDEDKDFKDLVKPVFMLENKNIIDQNASSNNFLKIQKETEFLKTKRDSISKRGFLFLQKITYSELVASFQNSIVRGFRNFIIFMSIILYLESKLDPDLFLLKNIFSYWMLGFIGIYFIVGFLNTILIYYKNSYIILENKIFGVEKIYNDQEFELAWKKNFILKPNFVEEKYFYNKNKSQKDIFYTKKVSFLERGLLFILFGSFIIGIGCLIAIRFNLIKIFGENIYLILIILSLFGFFIPEILQKIGIFLSWIFKILFQIGESILSFIFPKNIGVIAKCYDIEKNLSHFYEKITNLEYEKYNFYIENILKDIQFLQKNLNVDMTKSQFNFITLLGKKREKILSGFQNQLVELQNSSQTENQKIFVKTTLPLQENIKIAINQLESLKI